MKNVFEIKFVNNDIITVVLNYDSAESLINDFHKFNGGFLKITSTSGLAYYNVNHIMKIKMHDSE